MSLLSQASLVVVPSGYKEDVVYSVKPTDGSGDLTFTRASDGTRVNSQGLVENVPWNFVTYSEQFDNAAWSLTRASFGANDISPNGLNNAYSIIANTTNDDHFIGQNITVTNATVYTFSAYLKKGNKNWVRLWNTAIGYADFDLENGVVGTQSSAVGSIESVGNGWYRCAIVYTATSTATNAHRIYTLAGDNIRIFAGDGSTINLYIWGAQLNIGSTAKPYFPTTDRQNVPRLTYEGGCPSLLLEPQRTNLLTYSEEFDNAAWSKTRSTITANTAISPDGTQNADTYTDTTFTNNNNFFDRLVASTVGQSYTNSIFVKAGSAPYVFIGIYDSPTSYVAIFNPNTGVFTSTTSGITSLAVAYNDGWYRIIVTRTAANTGIYPFFGVCELSNTVIYSGVGSYTAYIWGVQLEESSYPTSYIPTTSAAVTRVADAAYKTGISSLIGQTEGTIFYDFVAQISPSSQSHFWLGSAGSEIGIYGSSSFIFYSSGGVSISGGSFATGQRYKIAFGYKENDYVAYVNGVQVGTDTSATVPATSALYVNSYSDFTEIQKKQVNQAVLFKTRLTNAELAALTTL